MANGGWPMDHQPYAISHQPLAMAELLTHRVPDRRGQSVGIREYGRAIECPYLPILHQDLPVHDRRPHVVSARGVDDVRDRIVERRLARRAHRDGNEVGTFSCLE